MKKLLLLLGSLFLFNCHLFASMDEKPRGQGHLTEHKSTKHNITNKNRYKKDLKSITIGLACYGLGLGCVLIIEQWLNHYANPSEKQEINLASMFTGGSLITISITTLYKNT